jgi:hypothetical protein
MLRARTRRLSDLCVWNGADDLVSCPACPAYESTLLPQINLGATPCPISARLGGVHSESRRSDSLAVAAHVGMVHISHQARYACRLVQRVAEIEFVGSRRAKLCVWQSRLKSSQLGLSSRNGGMRFTL